MASVEPIRVVTKRIPPAELAKYIGRPHSDMVKFVVDVERRILALGGALHVDAEAVLLDRESNQEGLWGGNYYPGYGEAECIEYTSMINVRPAQNNTSMLVQDPRVKDSMRRIVFDLLGRGEPLA